MLKQYSSAGYQLPAANCSASICGSLSCSNPCSVSPQGANINCPADCLCDQLTYVNVAAASAPCKPVVASSTSLICLTSIASVAQAIQQCKQQGANAVALSNLSRTILSASNKVAEQRNSTPWWQKDPLWASIHLWSVPKVHHRLLDLTCALVKAAAAHPIHSEPHTLALEAAAAVLDLVRTCTRLLCSLHNRAVTYEKRYKYKGLVITRWWESRGAAERVSAWLASMDCSIQTAVHRALLDAGTAGYNTVAIRALLSLAESSEKISKRVRLGAKLITNRSWRRLVLKLTVGSGIAQTATAAAGARAVDGSAAMAKLYEHEQFWRIDRQFSLASKPVEYCLEEASLRQQQKEAAQNLFVTDEYRRPKFPSKAAGFADISGAWARPDAGNRRKITF